MMVEGQIINVRKWSCILLANRVELYKKEVQELTAKLAEAKAFNAIGNVPKQRENDKLSSSSAENSDTSDVNLERLD